MKRIDLKKIEHNRSVGQTCEYIEPNIKEDAIFYEDGKPIGFYISSIKKYSPKASKLAELANYELRSKRVPKSEMKRSSGFTGKNEKEVLQYSTIIGSIPPKPHMRRPYPTISSVHGVKTAKNFIKAMLLLSLESEKLIKAITPEVQKQQEEIFKNVPKEWRFGNIFTSSISNYNIAADFHKDNANIKGCVNVIITKRENSKGGCTTVPDYGATVNSCDDSMLVYPAWKNLHAVTPIIPTAKGGYRNSLVFYPLKAFLNENIG